MRERAASDAELIRRQAAGAVRNLVRPGAYLGLAREALAGAGHVLAYPLGIVPLGLVPAPRLSTRPGPVPPVHPLQPLQPVPPTAPRNGHPQQGTPVLLVHGYFHNRSAFLALSRSLRRTGLLSVHTFDYNPMLNSMGQLAAQLAVEVQRVLAATGAECCMIVGHSMGGLVARSYVQDLGGQDTVDTVITLGTPHRGTYTSYLGPGRALAELRPGSPYLQGLEQTARPSAVRWIAYSSDLDVMITPSVNAELAHPALRATNIRLDDTGHLSLLVTGRVLRGVTAQLLQRHRDRLQPVPA